MKEHWGFTR